MTNIVTIANTGGCMLMIDDELPELGTARFRGLGLLATPIGFCRSRRMKSKTCEAHDAMLIDVPLLILQQRCARLRDRL